jgi:hypothetical protein
MTAPDWISLTAVNFGWALSLPYERDGTDVVYVRRDPAVLAELPEVQAMIAAAAVRDV